MTEGKDTKKNLENKKFEKLTKKKHISWYISNGLFYFSPEASSLKKSYQNSINCASILLPKEDKLTTHYCKNRWCPVCQSIRIAVLIKAYIKPLKALKEPYFVTLTAPTVGERELPNRIKYFESIWKSIRNSWYFKKNKPDGIRKMECTIRPQGKYHYHFHVIIDGKENAEWLVNEWVKRTEGANKKAQDIRPVQDGKYIELFKYFTKLITKDSRGKRTFNFERLNVIFEAIKGKRIYQTFGKIKQEKEEIEEVILEGQEATEEYLQIWRWATDVGYINSEGEILTGDYQLPKWVEELCRAIEEGGRLC